MRRFIAGTVIAGSLALATGAAAAPVCADRDQVIDSLADRYHEMLSAGGLQDETTLVEVWVSGNTGSWTILVTRADGMSCVVATGLNWQQHETATPAADDVQS